MADALGDEPQSTSPQCDVSVILSPNGSKTTDEGVIDILGRLVSADNNSPLGVTLRGKHQWAYFTALYRTPTVGPAPFVLRLPVQADRTKDAIQEIGTELHAMVNERTFTHKEFDRARRSAIFSLSGGKSY